MSPVGVLFFALAAASYIPSCSSSTHKTKFTVLCPKVGKTAATKKEVTFEKTMMTGWGVAKDAACAVCGVKSSCSSYKLFKGDDKKNDGSVIGRFTASADYSLKLYTSTDKKNLKYTCNNKVTPTPEEEPEVDVDVEDGAPAAAAKNAKKPVVKPSTEEKVASCMLSETLKACFKRDGCDGEVYDGSRKTSSTKVTAASTSKVYNVKPSFSFIKKLFNKATSADTKAAVRKAVDKVITNKDTIEEIARLMKLPETTISEITKIIQIGDRVYAGDVNGALTLIVGKDAAATEAETDVFDILEDVVDETTTTITERELTSLTELEKHRHSSSILNEDNFKIIVIGAGAGGGALVLLICCGGCVACCFCCKKKNKKSKEKVQVIYTAPAPPTVAVEMQTMEPAKMFSQPPVYQETALPV